MVPNVNFPAIILVKHVQAHYITNVPHVIPSIIELFNPTSVFVRMDTMISHLIHYANLVTIPAPLVMAPIPITV